MIELIPRPEFERIRAQVADAHARARLFADMCRFNTLHAVKRAPATWARVSVLWTSSPGCTWRS
jgi:hypothetical protein